MFPGAYSFNKESTKMMFVLLSFAILGYTTFLIFRETKNMRADIKRIKEELSEMTESLEGPVLLGENKTPDSINNQRVSGSGHGPAYTPPGLEILSSMEDHEINESASSVQDTISETGNEVKIQEYFVNSNIEKSHNEEYYTEPVFVNQGLETCSYVFKTGKRKGERCNVLSVEPLCRQHSKQKIKKTKPRHQEITDLDAVPETLL
jgi:hypothetical protein